ncbi:Putative membrane protein [Corynebacterium glyciniphilum AJ 3170]|uniref:Putative membrane protein n=1 Tax=Corynebacterium glyciniphilum AJ 3170 TaxID=1404245 RepID=X5DUY7_9CORY|nr:hypothetical protein [Corynebacterium glyciniphilum]AHW65109.1 Putative membrane protein [Corynebacterium glyciniphilum AJ 3170]
MKENIAKALILAIEFVVAVVFVVLTSRREGSITTDDVAYWLNMGAFWSVCAFLVSLALILIPRQFLWIDAIVVVIMLALSVWGQIPDSGPNFGKGFAWTLAPGILIGSAITLIYKVGSLVLSRSPRRNTA